MMSLPVSVVTILVTLFVCCAADDVTLTFLHTNDIHAHYDEFNKYGSACSKTAASNGECFGGYARLASAVKSLRQQYPNNLFLDAGDQYQGTLWFYLYGGQVTSHFMNWVQYDVMALGNHEFDKEIPGLVPFLKAVNFSVISSNINSSLEPDMQGLFTKSVERRVAGRRVGIIGYTTVDTPAISHPGRLIFNDVVQSVQREVQRFKDDGVNIIIALGHAGYSVDKQVGQIPGVDIVVGGHSHSFLYTGTPPSNEVPVGEYPTIVTRDDGQAIVVQCYTMAKYLCVLHVTFDDAGGIVNYEGKPQLQDNSVPQDNATLEELMPWRENVTRLSQDVVGETLVKLVGDREVCRQMECNMGNLIADGFIYQNIHHPSAQEWNDVSIALVNSGGVRASLARGDISIADIMTVQPFGNTVDAIEIKGEHLRAAFEHSVARLDPCDTTNLAGQFLQVSGVRVEYDLRQPVGERVANVLVLCTHCDVPRFEPLADDQVYKVILSSFVVDGGDGYTVIRDNLVRRVPLGDLDSDVFTNYVKFRSPIYQSLEGRIKFLDNSDQCGSNASTSTSTNVSCGSGPVSSGSSLISSFRLVLLCLFWLCCQWIP